MSNDETLSNKEMDFWTEAAEADTQAVVQRNAQVAQNQKLKNLADRLMKLHHDLENRNDRGADWSYARALEDRIGAYQQVAGDVEVAEALLKKYHF